mmetsp:Transcript_538/g.1191  ORF Transcript_538/g.1191 Transcript_538/m.1191 type:complete len:298 (+) Transcript_538:4199-5092(+)
MSTLTRFVLEQCFHNHGKDAWLFLAFLQDVCLKGRLCVETLSECQLKFHYDGSERAHGDEIYNQDLIPSRLHHGSSPEYLTGHHSWDRNEANNGHAVELGNGSNSHTLSYETGSCLELVCTETQHELNLPRTFDEISEEGIHSQRYSVDTVSEKHSYNWYDILRIPSRLRLDYRIKCKESDPNDIQSHGIKHHPELPVHVVFRPSGSFKGRQEYHKKAVPRHQPPFFDSSGKNGVQNKCQNRKLHKGPNRANHNGALEFQSHRARNKGDDHQRGHGDENLHDRNINERLGVGHGSEC